MVFVKDEGGFFKAPIEKVWKLVELHSTELTKIHSAVRKPTIQSLSETSGIASWEDENGERIKTKSDLYLPIGLAVEFIEGPLAGSRFFNYYTPNGDTTAVTVVGEFKSPTLSEDELKGAVSDFLQHCFAEDSEYLEKI